MNNFYDNIKAQYPYGEFPSQYTLNGQKELLEKFNNPKVSSMENQYQTSNQITPPSTSNSQTQSQGLFGGGHGLNIEQLLPLLINSGDKSNSQDLLKSLLPANSFPPQLLDVLLKKKNDTKTVSSTSTTNIIDNLPRIY